MGKRQNKLRLVQHEIIQSHLQRYQSTDSQHGSHVEPTRKKKKINLVSQVTDLIKCFGVSYNTHITIVGRRNNIFELLRSEDINGYKVTLGVTVLACLWSRNLNHLLKPIKNVFNIKNKMIIGNSTNKKLCPPT